MLVKKIRSVFHLDRAISIVGEIARALLGGEVVEKTPDRVRRFWNAPRIAARPGLKAVDLFAKVLDGNVKALWIWAAARRYRPARRP